MECHSEKSLFIRIIYQGYWFKQDSIIISIGTCVNDDTKEDFIRNSMRKGFTWHNSWFNSPVKVSAMQAWSFPTLRYCRDICNPLPQRVAGIRMFGLICQVRNTPCQIHGDLQLLKINVLRKRGEIVSKNRSQVRFFIDSAYFFQIIESSLRQREHAWVKWSELRMVLQN